ncbi:MAG: ATP-binding cassette domain-containing protein [Gammaproteobacteria bacterium]
MPSNKILEVKNLEKSFLDPNNNPFKVLNDISLSIDSGEILGLVGESGSGKTTLGRIIIRLLNSDNGQIVFDGQDITTLSKKLMRKVRRNMQIIFQDPFGSLNPRHTIKRIISEPLIIHQYNENLVDRVYELLNEVGLDKSSINLYPHEFSGGQRQRIAIARAIALKPKFLIADESVSALDVSIQSQILNLISRLIRENHISMIFISHDLSVIRHISDKVAVMNKGSIVEHGKTEDVLVNPSHNYTKMLINAVPGFKTNF